MAGDRLLAIPGTARIRGARWCVFGLSAFYGAVAATLALTVPAREVKWALTTLVAVALAAYLPLARLINRRPVVMTVDDRLLRLDRFGTVPLGRPMPRGAWYDRHSGVGLGTVLHVPTDRGRVVRVGGHGRITPTGLETAEATRSVDITLTTDDFDRLLAALGLGETDPAWRGRVRVALFDRVNRGRSGCLRLALPIFVLYVVALSVGGTMFLLDRWFHPGPKVDVAAGFGAAALVLVAIVATIWITQRRRPTPVLVVEFDADGCTLRDRRGRPVAAGRPTWQKLRYQYRDLSGNQRNCPVLELVVASHRPLTLGVLDPEYAWRKRVPETSMPRYLVGPPDWPPLLAALDRIGADRPT